MFKSLARFFGFVRTFAPPAATPAAPAASALPAISADQLKQALIGLLSVEKYRFRSLSRLMKGIGSSDAEFTKFLLREVGARPSYRDESKWGLKTRVGDRPGRRNFSY